MSLTLIIISYLILVLVCVTSLLLIFFQRWQWMLAVLAVQYLGLFVLVSLSRPLQMAAVKLLAGWMSVLVLWIARAELNQQLVPQENGERLTNPVSTQHLLSGRIFRLLTAIIVALVAVTVEPTLTEWIQGLRFEQAYGALFLILLGLLHLGLTAEPLHVIVGLLTVLCGFEIIYAVVEASVLVQGLLAGVNLGLALAGAYLVLAPSMGEAR